MALRNLVEFGFDVLVSVKWSPKANLLTVVDKEHAWAIVKQRLWSEPIQIIEGAIVNSTFDPSGRILLTFDQETVCGIFEEQRFVPLFPIPIASKFLTTSLLSNLIAAFDAGEISVYEADSFALQCQIIEEHITWATWNNQGNFLASTSESGLLKIWDYRTPSKPSQVIDVMRYVGIPRRAAYDPTDRWIAVTGGSNKIAIIDAADGSLIVLLPQKRNIPQTNSMVAAWATSVLFHPKRPILLSAGDRGVWMWNTTEWNLVDFVDQSSTIMFLEMDLEGAYLASGNSDSLHLWQIE